MVKRRLMRRDQAGASFFAFLSHIFWSQHKRRISHKAVMGARAHNGRSIFPRLEARRGTDTQLVLYAQPPLQVRRGGRTTTSMYCDTNVSRWENFLLARLPTITYGAYPSPSCPHVPYLVHACENVLFAHVSHTCCVCIDLSSRIVAYGPVRSVGVHTRL